MNAQLLRFFSRSGIEFQIGRRVVDRITANDHQQLNMTGVDDR